MVDAPAYQSHWLFLGLAMWATGLSISFSPMFYGYWALGRKVSMSPVETAKAFNTPTLRGTDSNTKSRALLREIENRPVQYGMVPLRDVRASGDDSAIPEGIRFPHVWRWRVQML